MPSVVLICDTCQEVRYQSIRTDYALGDKPTLSPGDFLPVGKQSPPSAEAPTCDRCQSALAFRVDADGRFAGNGQGGPPSGSPMERYQQAPAAGKSRQEAEREVLGRQSGEGAPQIHVFFQVQKDEQIKDLRELPGGDRWLVITNQRIVLVNLSGLL